MSTYNLQLNLDVKVHSEYDTEQIVELTKQFREEILKTGIKSVEYKNAVELPEGARCGVAFDWGGLFLTVTSTVTDNLIGVFQYWLNRHQDCSIIMIVDGDKLEIKGDASVNQFEIISQWLDFHIKKKSPTRKNRLNK